MIYSLSTWLMVCVCLCTSLYLYVQARYSHSVCIKTPLRVKIIVADVVAVVGCQYSRTMLIVNVFCFWFHTVILFSILISSKLRPHHNNWTLNAFLSFPFLVSLSLSYFCFAFLTLTHCWITLCYPLVEVLYFFQLILREKSRISIHKATINKHLNAQSSFELWTHTP